MSYPDPRYLGDKGEISAKFRPGDHALAVEKTGLGQRERTGADRAVTTSLAGLLPQPTA